MIVLGSVERWGTGGRDYFIEPDYAVGKPFVAEGTIDPDETVILDVRGYLGYNAHTGRIVNKGPGKLYVYISADGETFSDSIELEDSQTVSLFKEDVWKIKLETDTAGNSYLVVAH